MGLTGRAARRADSLATAAVTPFRGLRWEVRPPTRWPIAVRASLAVAIPLVVATLAGQHTWGLLTSTGAFAVLYGAGRPLRSRVRVLLLVAVGLVGCMALGTLTSGNAWATVAITALVGAVATFLAHALRLGPPGAFFFVLLVGIGGYLPTRGVDPLAMVGATALGAAIALPIALFDLLLDRHKPERSAVAAAAKAVDVFVGTPVGSESAEARSIVATNAIHDAWTTLWDSGDPVPADGEVPEGGEAPDDDNGRGEFVTDLLVAQQRFSERLMPGVQGNPDLARESMTASLRRPPMHHMIRRALRWPTTALQSALRVTAGIAAAGTISGVLLDTSHMYWAMAAAVLVLHTGMDRRSTAVRSVQRFAGTAVGILLFLLGGFSNSGPWAVVATMVLLQGIVQLLVVRNYTAAVVFLTPLALTISTAGSGLAALEIAEERLVDTAIGVLCGVAVPWFVGWRASRKMLAAHLSRAVSSSADVIARLAVGQQSHGPGLVAQRELSLDLQELSAVSGRAIRDEQSRVEDLVAVREATAWFGFTVLASALQTAPGEPLERAAAAEPPAREIATRMARQDIPDPQEIREVRTLVGRRPLVR